MTGTPHIEAAPGDIAPSVLLPGDPLRAQAMAEALFESPRMVNAVRNMLAFTGSWNGMPVTVFPSGIGIPSMALFVEELFRDYGVQRIIRVGTCGAVVDDAQLGDVVLVSSASTDSSFNRRRFGGFDHAPSADFELLRHARRIADEMALRARVGEIFTSDHFYDPEPERVAWLAARGIFALDMETAGLFALARHHGRRAAAFLTVSDVIPRTELASAEQRQGGYGAMAELALRVLEADARDPRAD